MPKTVKRNLPKGYTCVCGEFSGFHVWVYAHWYETITHKCKCGKKNSLYAVEVMPRKKRVPVGRRP